MDKTNDQKSAAEIRARDRSVLSALKEAGKLPLRKLAELCGFGKDKVRRALKAQERKQVYPESVLWESGLGQQWLHRMLMTLMLRQAQHKS